MIKPKQYRVNPEVTEKKLLHNKFVSNLDYYSYKTSLYGNYIFLGLYIGKDLYLVVNVHDNNGYTYAPFYNPDDRHNNNVYNQVVKKYTSIMHNFVKSGILEECEEEVETMNVLGNNTYVKIKKLKDNAVIPTRGSKFAAGYDLVACLDTDVMNVTIDPYKTVMIGTGLSIEFPDGYFGGIFARSGLASKQGLRPSNCVGVVDSDYRGEIKVALYNDSAEPRVVASGERIAQLILLPFATMTFEEVKELNDTERGEGGFGHTGR